MIYLCKIIIIFIQQIIKLSSFLLFISSLRFFSSFLLFFSLPFSSFLFFSLLFSSFPFLSFLVSFSLLFPSFIFFYLLFSSFLVSFSSLPTLICLRGFETSMYLQVSFACRGFYAILKKLQAYGATCAN